MLQPMEMQPTTLGEAEEPLILELEERPLPTELLWRELAVAAVEDLHPFAEEQPTATTEPLDATPMVKEVKEELR